MDCRFRRKRIVDGEVPERNCVLGRKEFFKRNGFEEEKGF